jgi:hypothetical protein
LESKLIVEGFLLRKTRNCKAMEIENSIHFGRKSVANYFFK